LSILRKVENKQNSVPLDIVQRGQDELEDTAD
jgi:hypothetical protein